MERAFAFAARLSSEKNLTQKAYLNSLAAGLDYCTRFAVAFFVTPLLVAGLGDLLFGVWTVVLRMMDYLNAGGRASQALKWFVVTRQPSQDFVEKRQGVGGAVVAWAVFLPLQIVLGAMVIWCVPVWIKVPPDLFLVVRAAAALVVGGAILQSVVGVPRSVLDGENLSYKRIWLSATLVVVGGLLTVTALHFNLGIVGVASAMLITTIITGLTFVVFVRFHVPWFGIGKPDRQMLRRFVGLSWWFMLWSLIVRVMTTSDVIILGVFASPEVITVYTLLRYLPEGLVRFITVIVFGTVPGFGKIFAGGDLRRAAQVRGEIMVLTWLATTVVAGTVLLWNDNFVQLWVGRQYAADSVTTLSIVLMVFQFVWIHVDANLINLTLDLRRKVTVGGLSAAMSLVLAVVFMRWCDGGIIGVCLGFICGRLILSITYPRMMGRVLQVPFQAQVVGAIRPAIVTACLFAALARLSTEVNVNTWLGLATAAPATFLLLLALAFFAGLSASRRRIVWNRLKVLAGTGDN